MVESKASTVSPLQPNSGLTWEENESDVKCLLLMIRVLVGLMFVGGGALAQKHDHDQ